MENLKSIKDVLMNMDGELTRAECAIEKGKFQNARLYDELSMKKTDYEKVYYWDSSRIMSEISLDYAVEVEKKLEAVRDLYNILFDMEKEKNFN